MWNNVIPLLFSDPKLGYSPVSWVRNNTHAYRTELDQC